MVLKIKNCSNINSKNNIIHGYKTRIILTFDKNAVLPNIDEICESLPEWCRGCELTIEGIQETE